VIGSGFGTPPSGLPTSLFELRRDKSTPQAGFKVYPPLAAPKATRVQRL